MATTPVPSQTDVAIQSATDGSVDYLQFTGNTLTGSANFNYGLGTDLKVVGTSLSGADPVLVTQSQSTGLVDFLTLNPNGSLKSTALSSVPLAPIVAADGSGADGIAVSQGPSGLDFGVFDTDTGQLIETDLVPGSANLPKVIGLEFANGLSGPAFNGVGTTAALVSQLPNGELDILGLAAGGPGSLVISGTDLLSQTIGLPSISAINQDGFDDQNYMAPGGPDQSLQLIGTVNGSQADAAYVNTGLSDPASAGALVGTNLLNPQFPNYHVVDASTVLASLFPVTP